ncbi:plasmid mobilization protein [Xanthomonas vesicatoria]|uniref:plasmid mobilization protein n=1 Tax=Xanthomonas vesicatoria TaxID=56460 RepID=UPI0024127940|nr:mobilization protein MobB [Xanthomonas vesicatoria]MDG4482255.1 mobilization protein MobB [Xanthomonas vesicatoria]
MTFAKGKDNRTERILLRVTPDEKATIVERAQEVGKDGRVCTVSEYLRARGLGQRVHSIADQKTINELRRLGGLLKKVHIDSHGAFSDETAEALRELVGAIRRVGK